MRNIASLMNLANRTALVTGATGHLGQVICATLAELGANLLVVDHPESNFDDLLSGLDRFGVNTTSYRSDFEDPLARKGFVEQIRLDHPVLNIIVNNAAIGGKSPLSNWAVPFECQSIDLWARVLQVNLIAAFEICQGLAASLRPSEGASVVNIASIYGVCAPQWDLYEGTDISNPAAYAASKAGLIQLTRWLATTMSPAVRVNAISPGGILRGQDPNFVERYASKTPLGRMAKENDFCGAIAYLCSDLSSYVTGQNLMIDGGWSCV